MHTVGLAVFATPLGACGLAWNAEGDITGAQLPEASEAATLVRLQRRFAPAPQAEPPPAVRSVMNRIAAALGGAPVDLASVALDLDGVPDFHRRVYAVARAIAPGHTLTYGEVAARMGEPGAARAVGRALGQNPFAPIVPCHRVLGAGSASGGFSAHGGADTKLKMLQIEGARRGDGPDLFD